MRKTIHLPESFRDKVEYLQAVTGRSFSSIVQEALKDYYERLKRLEKVQELEREVCGKVLLAPADEVLKEVEEMRHGSDRL